MKAEVDVGTSPHGLPAGCRERTRKHSEGGSTALSAKPVLTFPSQGGKDADALARPLCPPAGARLSVHGSRLAYYVPVAFVAKDWKVSPRRIRALLAAARLEGRREVNGYWEVAYPYRFIIGTRGPALKRAQKPERSTA